MCLDANSYSIERGLDEKTIASFIHSRPEKFRTKREENYIFQSADRQWPLSILPK